ncbi:MAG: hypothetical protein JWN78_2539 [Bacteroidota bacterium]|nr:hypothetical protein [Bacteroidota bacterium]
MLLLFILFEVVVLFVVIAYAEIITAAHLLFTPTSINIKP